MYNANVAFSQIKKSVYW